ncbi:hypothetical protein RhiirA5_478876 [Rhizophagus irregularis]|uniref:Bas1p n=1 Tax=Rhizophagus irregularis TaxID=588596 RepID=A0A2N0PLZ3_9GLOM|nr:hypothetical protein RhiirA5_478876 [Rhizophagus irregularis]CAB5195660.1 unnamed protein product [Rhizophagus irregularis]
MYNNNTQPQDSFLLHRPALPPPNFINAYQQDVTHNRNNNTNTASTLTNTLPPILPRIAPAGPIPLPPTPQTRPRPSRPKYKIKTDKTAWTADEDNLLRLAVQLYGDRSERWTKIAACVPGRTNKMCRKRWFHSLDPNLRKGPWTEEEDDLLRKAVEKHNRVWCKVAESIPGRTDDQCAKRWKECLDPDIDHTEWTDQEDALLMQKYSEFGSQWQQIAQFFQGRPGLHCRNRWRKIQRLKKAQKDPSMDMIIITPNDITTTNSSSSPHTSTSSLSTTLNSTPQNVLQPNLQSNAQSNLTTNNMQSNVQQQSNTQPHVQSRSSSIMSRQNVNLQQSHIHSNLQQQRLTLNNASPNLSANLQSNLQPNLQSNLQSNLQPNLSSKSNLSSNYVSNYPSKSNNNVSATSLLKLLPSNLSSNLTNNSTSSIPSSIAPPSIENNTPDTMTHLPSTSSSGPTIASLLSSPSTSVSNNQMNLDILDDQGNSQPQSQPSQETEVETNVKAYGCGVTGCEVSFPSANGLYYHMKAAHPTNNADKPFRCALAGCSKKYKNINGLQYHIDNAKGSSGHKYDTEEGAHDTTVKPFKCPVAGCKNNYVSANGLQYHQKNVHRKDADKYRGPHKVNSQNNQRSDDSDPQSSPHAEIDSTDTAPSLNEQSWINNVSNDSNNQPLPMFNIFQPQFNDPEILSFNESSHFKCCHNGCGKSFNTIPELNDHVSSDHRSPMRQKRRIMPHSE